MTKSGWVASIIAAILVTFLAIQIVVSTQDSDTPEQAKQIQQMKEHCVELGGDYTVNSTIWMGATRATQSVTCRINTQVTE